MVAAYDERSSGSVAPLSKLEAEASRLSPVARPAPRGVLPRRAWPKVEATNTEISIEGLTFVIWFCLGPSELNEFVVGNPSSSKTCDPQLSPAAPDGPQQQPTTFRMSSSFGWSRLGPCRSMVIEASTSPSHAAHNHNKAQRRSQMTSIKPCLVLLWGRAVYGWGVVFTDL